MEFKRYSRTLSGFRRVQNLHDLYGACQMMIIAIAGFLHSIDSFPQNALQFLVYFLTHWGSMPQHRDSCLRLKPNFCLSQPVWSSMTQGYVSNESDAIGTQLRCGDLGSA
jgi:hypothetical protein